MTNTTQAMDTLTMRDMIDQGYLVPPTYFAPVDPMEINLDEVVRQYYRLCEGKRAIVFCATQAHAAVMSAKFCESGIPGLSVTADMSQPERKRAIDSYLAGQTMVLTTVSVLLDSPMPETECVIVAKPTRSQMANFQMIAAGTRPQYAADMPRDNSMQRRAAIAASGKQKCMVLDFAGNIQRLGMPS